MLAETWMSVLEYDYRPVFQPARNVVRHLGKSEHRTAAWRAIRRLAAWADENAEHYATMGMEYAGQLFSRVMGHQAADGAYFTRPEAARLLAELALDQMEVANWNDPAGWPMLTVADLACGSGTLLHAWIEGVKDRMRVQGADQQRCAAWHKKAVEELTTGLDINPVSLQLAAGRFTLGNLDVDYRKMALYNLEHGRVGAAVRLGALELLGDDEIIGPAPDSFQWDDDDLVHPDVKSALTGTRAVLINPPFSDNTKRNRNVDAETKRAMQRREKDLRDRVLASDEPAGRLIDINSIRTFFTPLIHSVLDADGGVLAKILPMTACTAASGVQERQFLASRFWIKFVVMCHDPKNINLSQETKINECLLIATRRGAGEGRPTTFVKLSRFPLNTADAGAIAAALRDGNFDAIGRATEWPADRVEAGDWSPIQWYDSGLATVTHDIVQLPGMERAVDLYAFGSPGQAVRDEFERVPPGEEQADDIWVFSSIREQLRTTLDGEPDARWRVKPHERRRRRARVGLPQEHLAKASHVLAALSYRTTSSRTTAQYCSSKFIGSGYVPLATVDEVGAKALNLIWNSTPTLLQLLSMRSMTAAYPQWAIAQLEGVRLPASLKDPNVAKRLARIHDDLAAREIGRLQYAADDPVRHAIDAAVCRLYGLDETTVHEWRGLLSQEPFNRNVAPDEPYDDEMDFELDPDSSNPPPA